LFRTERILRLQSEAFLDRRKQFRQHLAARKLPLAIISDPRHVYYFTGFQTANPRLATLLFVSVSGASVLLVGQTEAMKARRVFKESVLTFKDYDVRERMVVYPELMARLLKKYASDLRPKSDGRVGIESWQLPAILVETIKESFGVSMLDVSEDVLSMRFVKSHDEVKKIKEGCRWLDEAHRVIKPMMQEGVTEISICARVQETLFNRTGRTQLVLGDYLSGERTLEISGYPTKRELRRGDTMIVDLQTTCEQYWADTTRTFTVGKPTQQQTRIWNVLIKARKAVELILKPGTLARDVYKAAFGVINRAGYGGLFPHHVGHGIGLDSQEAPFFLVNSRERLENGVVCAIEPGIYHKGIGGIRLEDVYLITEDGFDRLSTFPLELS
jgi:Xaa-Pro dipeptidase